MQNYPTINSFSGTKPASIFSSNASEIMALEQGKAVYERRLFDKPQEISKQINEDILQSHGTLSLVYTSQIIGKYRVAIEQDIQENHNELFLLFFFWNRKKFNEINRYAFFDIESLKRDVKENLGKKGLFDYADTGATQTHTSYIMNTIQDDVNRAIGNSQEIINNEILNLLYKKKDLIEKLNEAENAERENRQSLAIKNKLLFLLQRVNAALQELEQNKYQNLKSKLAASLAITSKNRLCHAKGSGGNG